VRAKGSPVAEPVEATIFTALDKLGQRSLDKLGQRSLDRLGQRLLDRFEQRTRRLDDSVEAGGKDRRKGNYPISASFNRRPIRYVLSGNKKIAYLSSGEASGNCILQVPIQSARLLRPYRKMSITA